MFSVGVDRRSLLETTVSPLGRTSALSEVGQVRAVGRMDQAAMEGLMVGLMEEVAHHPAVPIGGVTNVPHPSCRRRDRLRPEHH